MTILTYLAAIGSFSVLVSVMMALTFQHQFFSTALQQQQAARNLAEAAIQQAIVRVLHSPNQSWGAAAHSSEVIRVTSAIYPQARGVVSFNAAAARAEEVALSYNHLKVAATGPGSLERQIPANCAQVIGRGVCGNSVKTIEVLFYVPPFPNALASEGPIRSRGGLLVGGLLDPEKYVSDYASVADEDKSPAHVISNFNSPTAVDLGPGATILGNVAAVGGVVMDSTVTVSGEVRQYIEPQPVPKLDLTALFRKVGGEIGSDALDPDIPGLNLTWNAHRNGNLVVRGNLNLDSGVLLVRGNLTVHGGVSGSGAVLVDGETHIRGGAALNSTDQVALVSSKRIVLDGGGKNSYFFQGLMYTEEEVLAENVTVIGAVIARGLAGLELNDVNLINAPVTVSLVDGLELRNYTDDDSAMILIRAQERDPKTRHVTKYKAWIRGFSDEPRGPRYPVEYTGRDGWHVSTAAYGQNLTSFEELKAFFRSNLDRDNGYAKNAYNPNWYWTPADGDSDGDIPTGKSPLQEYLDRLDGKTSDRHNVLTLNLNPNEVLGVLERSRILLWREVSN